MKGILSIFSNFSKKNGGGESAAKLPPRIDRKTYQALESEQREMIRGVVELSDTTVKEVMVPRTDTVFLSASSSRDELLARIAESGHSRFPVYEDTIDHVTGILYVKDVLRALVQGDQGEAPAGNSFDIKTLLRKPFFVPVSKHIDDLLRELRRRRVQSPWWWTNTAGFRG
jgi:CBS domain containing-hemolysin-like protein